MNRKLNLAAIGAGIALLLPVAAHAIDPKYAKKLETSGCTQATELQGCDINKTKAENAKAGFVATPAASGKQSYHDKLEQSGCTQASELQGCDINKSKAENAKAGFGAAAATGSGDGAPAAAIKACNKFADQGYDGTIMSQSALKPGMWEIVIRFEQYRYACNVSSSGKVSSFNKLD
jgi:hypothetical protein